MPCLRRPGRRLADRPGEPDPGHVGALPQRRHRRHPGLAERRHPERGQVAQRAGEAGRGDHLVGHHAQVLAGVGALEVDPQRVAVLDDRGDRGVEDLHAQAQEVVLERLDVAGPDPGQRPLLDRGLGGRRRAHGDRRRPGREPGGELEPGVLLADDEDPLAGVPRRIAGVGVVARELDARRRRAPRLGHAHGEHEVRRPVRAVGGLEHEDRAVRALLHRRRLPLAVVADRDARPLGERLEVRLHLRPRREVRRPVHELGLQRPQLGLVGDQAVPVVALVLAGGPRLGRVRLGPRQQPLEERPLAEHAARGRVA